MYHTSSASANRMLLLSADPCAATMPPTRRTPSRADVMNGSTTLSRASSANPSSTSGSRASTRSLAYVLSVALMATPAALMPASS